MTSDLRCHEEAIEELDRLLNARSKKTRLACAHTIGKLTRLPGRKGSQLRQLETAREGLYAISEVSLPGREVVLFFSALEQESGLCFKILHAKEVIGETQYQAEYRVAEARRE
jgi:hypothetical protein